MQTWTAIQIPTSKLRKDNSFRIQTELLIQNLSEDKQDLPEADVVLECELDPVNNLWDLRNHSESRYPNEILQRETKTLEQPDDHIKPASACSGVCPDLRDVGLAQYGLDVLRDEIGTSRREHSGHDEDDQGPPAGPVDHCSMVAGHCTDRRRDDGVVC